MSAVFGRLLLLVVGSFLIGAGWVSEDTANIFLYDPDVQMLVGAGLMALWGVFYRLAKKRGWTT